MKVLKVLAVISVLAFCVLPICGCKEKEETAAEEKMEETVEREAAEAAKTEEEAEKAIGKTEEIVEEEVEEVTPEAVPEPVPQIEKKVDIIVDEGRDMNAIRAEAATMDDANLRSATLAYRDAIFAKQANLADVTSRLETIPESDRLGMDAQSLQQQSTDLTQSIGELTQRYQIYFDALQGRGIDVSGLGLE